MDHADLAPLSTPSRSRNAGCRNRGFVARVDEIRRLRAFILREGLAFPEKRLDGYLLGPLDAIRYDRRGDEPTGDDWRTVEHLHYLLNAAITGDSRRRYNRLMRRRLPASISWWALGILAVALLALTGAAHPDPLARLASLAFGSTAEAASIMLAAAALWCLCLGALGAIANLGFNALVTQADLVFDMTSRQLVLLRVVLGALFGFVVGLPVGWAAFQSFVLLLQAVPTAAPAPPDLHVILALAPLLLGFATSLILRVFQRITEAAEALFGIAAPAGRRDRARSDPAQSDL